MSKTPIRASRPAAVVCGMPWSWAAGMKWVPIRPFVDQPQIQKVPTRIQKVRDRRLSRSVPTASRAARGLPRRATGPARASGSGALDAVGAVRRRRRRRRGGRASDQQHERHEEERRRPVTTSAAYRQPGPVGERPRCRGGRRAGRPRRPRRRCPVTRPRWASTNQRFATIAPRTSAIAPVPTPTATPHSSHSCQACGHQRWSGRCRPRRAAAPGATTRRMPKRSIRAAANGAVSP